MDLGGQDFRRLTSRRSFLGGWTLAVTGLAAFGLPRSVRGSPQDNGTSPYFERRGVTVWATDLARWDWPAKAHAAGLNTIATHHDPAEILAFLGTEKGKVFQADCARFGLDVEHSLHSYSTLLPRDLFTKDPSMFRMNRDGADPGFQLLRQFDTCPWDCHRKCG